MPVRQGQYGGSEGNIHEKDPSPGTVFNQEAAKDRPPCRGDRREAGPCTDCTPPVTFRKRRADDREASRHQQRSPDSLYASRENQLAHVGRQTAPDGSCGEQDDAGSERPFAAIDVTERSTDQNQGGEKKGISFNNPLHVNDCGVEVGLQRRQCKIDDASVDKGEA
jgi:hypothetical protein